MSERPAYVYLLRCRGGSLYCGWTYDVEARLAVHRAGKGSRYVKRRLPAEIAAVFEMPDASAARKEEARIKKLTRSEKLALLLLADPGENGAGVDDDRPVGQLERRHLRVSGRIA